MTTHPNTTSSASIVQRVLSTDDSLVALALRFAGVALFVAHGTQKLFSAFGGYALALFALSVSLLVSGGGRIFVDRVLSTKSE